MSLQIILGKDNKVIEQGYPSTEPLLIFPRPSLKGAVGVQVGFRHRYSHKIRWSKISAEYLK